ncbi:hypothetical protein N8755_02935 [Alphaproteobacteria bacterium]|nr:hypothetical protein [Alphaproteobacteria bacterium]
MIPHRPKRQDIVLPFQGNDQHNVLSVADQATKQVINRPPVITGGQAHTIKISEHTPGFSLIATIAATDPDGDRLTYRLTEGAILTIGEYRYEQFYLAADDISVTGQGRDLYLVQTLHADITSPHVLTFEISDGVNTVTATITIEIDTAIADIAITANAGADLAALEAGDVITGSVVTADPDGVAPNTDVTWRWFHDGNPSITIGTGTSYTITSFDWGRKIGLELIYTDTKDAAQNTQSRAFAISQTIARPQDTLTTTAPQHDGDIDGLADYLLGLQPFARPDTGAVVITWKLDKLGLAANIIRPMIEQAFAHVARYINIDFVETQDYDAHILLNVLPSRLNPRVGGIAEAEGRHRVISFFLDADDFTDKDDKQRTTSRLILHELGHALGLKHPFQPADDGGIGDHPWPYHAPFISNMHTIMSYDNSDEKGTSETLKSADIIALQRLYGKAPNTDIIDENTNNIFTGITFDISGLDAATVTWAITGQGADKFQVVDHSGSYTLKIIQPLDYETATRHDLVITATDANSALREQAVIITVADKNDNAPILAFHDTSPMAGLIRETSLQTGVIFSVSQLDSADIITWTIANTGISTGADKFTLKRNGVLYQLVLKPDAVLDDNTDPDIFELAVTVSDGTFSSMPVQVQVHKNNIAPVITSDHSAPVIVSEAARRFTFITKVTATDTERSPLIYRIIDGNDDGYFLGTSRLDGIEIVVLSPLDFETASRHVLTVSVSDGVHTITTRITIHVTNVDEGDVEISIAGAAGVDLDNLDVGDSIMASVTAADPDGIAPNTAPSWRWYHVDAPDKAIGTDAVYIITSSDRRKKLGVEYIYTDPLDAADNSVTTVSSELDAIVPPEPFMVEVEMAKFALPGLNPGEIEENKPDTYFGLILKFTTLDGTPIDDLSHITVAISSDDAVDHSSGFIIYKSIGTGEFSLRSSLQPLDYEIVQDAPINLIITAMRQGATATTTAQIQLIDVNDNAPVLTASGTGLVLEGTVGVTTGITFSIADADTDAVNRFLWHHFTITSDVTVDPENSIGSKFEIRSIGDQWALKLKKGMALDYESLPSPVLTLQVTVSDGKNISAPVTVNMLVGDVNGRPIFLERDNAATLDQMADPGTLIFQLPALYDETLPLTYMITAGNTGNLFAIDNQGQITLASGLDNVAIDTVYTLTVTVSDGQGGDTATVAIRVIHVLDTVMIWENHPVSKPAAVISVPAELAGATMRLSGDQPDNALFRLDATGKIWWLGSPDFETPIDADADNIYAVEIIFTKNSVDSKAFVHIHVGDLGSGRSIYDPVTLPDGDGRARPLNRDDGEPDGLANYLLGYDPYDKPDTGTLIITWAFNSSVYPDHIARPWMEWAFNAFEAVINIRFIEVEYHAAADLKPDLEINFIEGGGGGEAYVNSDNRKINFFEQRRPALGNEFAANRIGDQYKTLLHEIGHALGLSHPFEAINGWPADSALRSSPDTIMSYFISFDSGLRHLGIADVAALQFLYGAPHHHGAITENAMGVDAGISFHITTKIPTNATWIITGTDADKFEVIRGQDSWMLKLKSGQSLDYEAGDTRALTITLVHDDYDFIGIAATVTVINVNDIVVPMKADDNDITLPDTGSEVDTGDGSDTITGGAGNDKITGGKGDDKIDLGASDADTDIVIYSIGGKAAKDGSDHITNFNRGVDQFVFALESDTQTSAITDYDSFLNYITKGTATLDDDEFRVQLDLGKDSDGNSQIEGLFFHFASSTFYSGGRLSLPLMKISFADPIDAAGITNIFTDDTGQMVDVGDVLNRYYFITDLDILDDLMGGINSVGYNITPEMI